MTTTRIKQDGKVYELQMHDTLCAKPGECACSLRKERDQLLAKLVKLETNNGWLKKIVAAWRLAAEEDGPLTRDDHIEAARELEEAFSDAKQLAEKESK